MAARNCSVLTAARRAERGMGRGVGARKGGGRGCQRRHAAVPVERQALRSAHEISSAWRWLARGIGVTHTTPGPVLHLLLSRLSRYRNQIKSNHVGRVLVRVHNQKLNAHSSFFRAAVVPHFPDEAIKRVRPYGCLCHSCSDSSALALGGLPLAVRFGIT